MLSSDQSDCNRHQLPTNDKCHQCQQVLLVHVAQQVHVNEVIASISDQ